VVLKQLKDVFNSIVKGEGCTNNKWMEITVNDNSTTLISMGF
jgi:hypothetical protein